MQTMTIKDSFYRLEYTLYTSPVTSNAIPVIADHIINENI